MGVVGGPWSIDQKSVENLQITYYAGNKLDKKYDK